jgi:hypothetical protein
MQLLRQVGMDKVTEFDAELAELERRFPFPASELARMERREWILNYAPKGAVGAEVGVFRGHFSERILQILQPRKFYLIDPWTKFGDHFDFTSAYTSGGNLTTRDAYREAQLRTRKSASAEIRFIEGFFLDVMERIEEPLDWIYLDTTHKYEDTRRELNVLPKLLKPNGLIMGDDWYPDPSAVHHGVFRAIQEFVRHQPYQVVGAGPGAQYCLRRTPRYGSAVGTKEPSLAQRFSRANVTLDGRLTWAQAKAGGMPRVARNFGLIDAERRGYVILDQVRNFFAASK